MTATGRDTTKKAQRLAELTFRMFQNCQEKERRIAERFGLTVTELRCIRSFGDDEALGVHDLAQRLEVSTSRVTRVVRCLEDKGLVRRYLEPRDRRQVIVHLTRRGWSLAERLNREYIALHEEILQHLDPQQHDVVLEGMDALLQAFHKWMQEDLRNPN